MVEEISRNEALGEYTLLCGPTDPQISELLHTVSVDLVRNHKPEGLPPLPPITVRRLDSEAAILKYLADPDDHIILLLLDLDEMADGLETFIHDLRQCAPGVEILAFWTPGGPGFELVERVILGEDRLLLFQKPAESISLRQSCLNLCMRRHRMNSARAGLAGFDRDINTMLTSFHETFNPIVREMIGKHKKD